MRSRYNSLPLTDEFIAAQWKLKSLKSVEVYDLSMVEMPMISSRHQKLLE